VNAHIARPVSALSCAAVGRAGARLPSGLAFDEKSPTRTTPMLRRLSSMLRVPEPATLSGRPACTVPSGRMTKW